KSVISTSTITVVDAPLTASPATISSVTVNTALSNVLLATFTDGDSSGTTTDYSGTINWGDGSALGTASITTGTGGAFNVSGTHTYTTPGSFPISVVIKDSGGAQTGVLTSVNILPVTWTPPTPYSGPVSDPNTDLVSVGEADIGINTGGLRLS